MPKFINQKLKEKIKLMVSKNIPIRVISKKLKLPISTVHYNVRKISKTYRKLYPPKINTTDYHKIGEVVGVITGDGSIFDRDYRISIILSHKEIEYAKFIQNLFLDVFGKKFNIFLYPRKNEIIISTRSREIYNFVLKFLSWEKPKSYSIHLKNRNYCNDFFRGFLRGMFDTDGNIDDWKSYKRLTITSTSKKLVNDIKYALKLFGISFYIRKYATVLRVRIDKKNAIKFIELIGFHNNRYNFLGESSSLV